jgi:hypothetical protein
MMSLKAADRANYTIPNMTAYKRRKEQQQESVKAQ